MESEERPPRPRHYTGNFLSPLEGTLAKPIMTDMAPVKTRIAGISFDNRDGTRRQDHARLVRKGDVLTLRREPENPYDANAIAVCWVDRDGVALQLGYVPRPLAMLLAPLVDEGAQLSAKVIRTGGGGLQQVGVRMQIDIDTSALPESRVTGLEPELQIAAQAPDDGPDPGLAPTLGGGR